MVLPCIRFIHKDGMLVGVKAFYEKRRCMMVDRQVVAVEVLECSDERVSGEEMRSSDYKLTNGVFFVDLCNLKLSRPIWSRKILAVSWRKSAISKIFPR